MKIAIHGRQFNEESVQSIQKLFDELNQINADLLISRYFHDKICHTDIQTGSYDTYQLKDDLSNIDFMISVGGDGTLLEAVTHVGALEIPVLGINMGRLGFLATTHQNSISSAIEALYKKLL